MPLTDPALTDPALTIRDLDPSADLDLLCGWLQTDRARFWGMAEKPREEIEEIYTWLQEQPHLAAYIVELDGDPVALFQTWDPEVDELGTFYDRRPGDLGMHLFLADSPAREGRTEAVIGFFVESVIAAAGVTRVVVEPDAANEASLARLDAYGFQRGPVVELPHKVAQYAFLDLP
ncbi:RimJ/RimL family protein N-acetyltransferase [Nocardioides albertanoniae]|uniref:Lysine N-acyltransferase MbtK n=1 Tax=Nocardioides albertanoniae TaxID=1175486 RepID=A0A543A5I4_9ACTN|nr:GNAT family N-acetyltransferase [Nocardioides albertanoniae]TQL67850.1 RimJ/RimL family protein N-acetyltransferase [Nocardioides albertanoniae]